MTALSWLWRVLRRGWPCCLLVVVFGLTGCKNCETNPSPSPSHLDAPSASDGAAKPPPRSDAADGLWMNSDRAKKISHDLDKTID